jgi:hypothetical protein
MGWSRAASLPRHEGKQAVGSGGMVRSRLIPTDQRGHTIQQSDTRSQLDPSNADISKFPGIHLRACFELLHFRKCEEVITICAIKRNIQTNIFVVGRR